MEYNTFDSNLNICNLIEFSRIIKDLLNDLLYTFNDKVYTIITNDKHYSNILKYSIPNTKEFEDLNIYDISICYKHLDNDFLDSSIYLFNYCKNIFPSQFFHILYQNVELFDISNNSELLPDIHFSELYLDDNTSDKTKEIIWKYLQIILFSVVTSVDDKNSFGNCEQLFQYINNEEFKNKLESTVKDIENIFHFRENFNNNDLSNNTNTNTNTSDSDSDNNVNFNNIFEKMSSMHNDLSSNENFNFNNIFEKMNSMHNDLSKNLFDSSNIKFNNLPTGENIHDHINNIINGKIGSLAKELAEETTKDLDIDLENISDVNDVFKNLFKNPSKLNKLISNIGNKIDTKMKDGSIKESELLEEASSIFKNISSMPGMGNFDSILKSMNIDKFGNKGGKINSNAFSNMMDQNIKLAKMKERMKKKAESNNNTPNYEKNYSEKPIQNMNLDTNNLDELNSNLSQIMQQLEKNQKNQTTTSNNINQTPRKKHNNKKKGNKKK